jgi:sorting nexin-1/2
MYEVSEAEASFLGVGLEAQPNNTNDANTTINSSSTQPSAENVASVKKPKSKKNSVYCLVREPEKVGDGINSYVTYKVHTKHDNSDKPVISVRRYSDFLWLHDRLAEEYIEVIIPPVPEKVLVNTTSSETVDYRRRELEKFLKRVLRHEALNMSQYLRYFLTASESDMANYRSTIKQHTRPNLIKEEQSFFSSSLSWMQSAAQSVMSKTGQDYSLVKEVDPEFQETKQYFSALHSHFDNLHAKAADDLTKTRQLAESLGEFSHSADLMATCEANQDAALAGYWKKLSGILRSMSELQEVLAKNETLIFDNTLRDYVRITDAGMVRWLDDGFAVRFLVS